MSTTWLTIAVTLIIIAAPAAIALRAKDLSDRVVALGVFVAGFHMIFLLLAYIAYAESTMTATGTPTQMGQRVESLHWLSRPIYDFPTWLHDGSAWVAIALIVTGATIKVIKTTKETKEE